MGQKEEMGFWDHLEVFRGTLIRSLSAIFILSIAAFFFKEPLFDILFAPAKSDFILYRILGLEPREVKFINIELASQFMVHLEVSLVAGLVCAMPVIVAEMYRFVAPALYEKERRYSVGLIAGGIFLFVAGVLLNYFIIFPFAFRFLAEYQVDPMVVNQISLGSYISTLLMLSLIMGVLFEMPVLAWFLGRLGLVDAAMMGRFRRHALVCLLILSAVITPTGDAVTLTLVTLPLYALYEVSIIVVRCGGGNGHS